MDYIRIWATCYSSLLPRTWNGARIHPYVHPRRLSDIWGLGVSRQAELDEPRLDPESPRSWRLLQYPRSLFVHMGKTGSVSRLQKYKNGELLLLSLLLYDLSFSNKNLGTNLSSEVWVSLVAQLVKNPTSMRETWVQSRGLEDLLEKGIATHSSILAGDFHGLYSPWGRKETWLSDLHFTLSFQGFPDSSAGKESACNAGDLGSIPGSGRYPGEGKGCPPQYSGLENSMDCIVHGVNWATFTFKLFKAAASYGSSPDRECVRLVAQSGPTLHNSIN